MIKTLIIAEIGINFAFGNRVNRFVDHVKKLIDVAVVAGADYVKFQKRDPDSCVPFAERAKPKQVPWREEETSYFQYKKDIELSKEHYLEIDAYCKSKEIGWFVSVWDENSVDFAKEFKTTLPNGSLGTMMKVPSAKITDLRLLRKARENSDLLLISTGMSTQEEIDAALLNGEPDVVFHTNSTYPAPNSELNLDYILYLDRLAKKSFNCFEVGYSGHEFGLTTTVAATLLGATWIERHLTLDRSLWGSDQLASVEPQGFIKLVKSIRDVEAARGGFGPRKVLASELKKRQSLRG